MEDKDNFLEFEEQPKEVKEPAPPPVEKFKGGYGAITGPVPGSNIFSSTNQPSDKNRKMGYVKRKFTRQALKDILSSDYKFAPNSRIMTQLTAAFGNQVKTMNVGQIMGLMQAQKAILHGDTYAFSNLINQALGLPTQTTELTGNPMQQNLVFLSADKLTDEQVQKYLEDKDKGKETQDPE